MAVFSKNSRHFFSKSRTCTRIGAFESPMSQLAQEFFFVFRVPLENVLEALLAYFNRIWASFLPHALC